MKCNVCKSETNVLFKGLVMNKYQVEYYKCPKCDFIQTEEPYWLDEAYGSAITDLDIGLVSRNLQYSKALEDIIKNNLDYTGKFLDYAGGYGLFVRLMRDRGFDFYRQDKYCENIFAKHFDLEDTNSKNRFEAVTTFEVFEHLPKPLEEIEIMLNYSDTIIFSTELLPKNNIKNINDWWYFTPETGQHISFYSLKTLKYIADKHHLFFYSQGPIHMLTKKKLGNNPLDIKQISESKNVIEIKSLTQPDYELAKKITEKTGDSKKELNNILKNKNTDKIDQEKKIINRLALIHSQLELKEEGMELIKSQLESTELDLESMKPQLESTKSQLNTVSSELLGVYASRSWRVVKLLHKIAKMLIPQGSLRRRVVGIFFRFTKRIARVIFKIKRKTEEVFLKSEIILVKIKPRKRRKINKESKKIVYIGHSYHDKTKSTAFLTDYLSQNFDVKVVLDESWRGEGASYPDLSFIDDSYLGVIFFQNLPDKGVVEGINNDNLIFFPMYDATSNWDYGKWRNTRGLKIINFSSTLHNKLSGWGFESIYVQYFPKPHEFIAGKKEEAFFWQRLTFINIDTIKQLLGKTKIKVHVHKAIDPHQEFIRPSKEDEKRLGITYSDWFETREAMWDMIKKKGIYVAPREYEGIGMSFLEAMAMGKAVIAVDNPTMNEYIQHGKTGYLFELSNPKAIDLENTEEVQKNTYKYMQEGYKKWEKYKHKIIDFIER